MRWRRMRGSRCVSNAWFLPNYHDDEIRREWDHLVMRLYLGIDGGQSSTTALIGEKIGDDTGRVLGTGRAGPCNHAAAKEGRRKFLAAITDSVHEAAQAAGINDPAFEAACLGLSGGPDDKEALAKET